MLRSSKECSSCPGKETESRDFGYFLKIFDFFELIVLEQTFIPGHYFFVSKELIKLCSFTCIERFSQNGIIFDQLIVIWICKQLSGRDISKCRENSFAKKWPYLHKMTYLRETRSRMSRCSGVILNEYLKLHSLQFSVNFDQMLKF